MKKNSQDHFKSYSLSELKVKAADLRCEILSAALRAGKGHLGGALSTVEILVTIYYGGILRFRSREPNWGERDRFLLSKGHATLTLYAVLKDQGFFSEEIWEQYGKDGALLAGHPDPLIPGIENISGSLGHGLSLGAGLALSEKLNPIGRHFFVLLGDAECQEGSVWEAAMFASSHALHSLIAIVDRNGIGATDFTENFLALEPFADRWRSFGWEVLEVSGHSISDLLSALQFARENQQKPTVIIAQTVKGFGVSFMENSPTWHHKIPTAELAKQAIQELTARRKELLDILNIELER